MIYTEIRRNPVSAWFRIIWYCSLKMMGIWVIGRQSLMLSHWFKVILYALDSRHSSHAETSRFTGNWGSWWLGSAWRTLHFWLHWHPEAGSTQNNNHQHLILDDIIWYYLILTSCFEFCQSERESKALTQSLAIVWSLAIQSGFYFKTTFLTSCNSSCCSATEHFLVWCWHIDVLFLVSVIEGQAPIEKTRASS